MSTKKVYQYYQEPQGETAIRTQLRVPRNKVQAVRKLDKIGRRLQAPYKYSRNQAILEAVEFYIEHHV